MRPLLQDAGAGAQRVAIECQMLVDVVGDADGERKLLVGQHALHVRLDVVKLDHGYDGERHEQERRRHQRDLGLDAQRSQLISRYSPCSSICTNSSILLCVCASSEVNSTPMRKRSPSAPEATTRP